MKGGGDMKLLDQLKNVDAGKAVGILTMFAAGAAAVISKKEEMAKDQLIKDLATRVTKLEGGEES